MARLVTLLAFLLAAAAGTVGWWYWDQQRQGSSQDQMPAAEAVAPVVAPVSDAIPDADSGVEGLVGDTTAVATMTDQALSAAPGREAIQAPAQGDAQPALVSAQWGELFAQPQAYLSSFDSISGVSEQQATALADALGLATSNLVEPLMGFPRLADVARYQDQELSQQFAAQWILAANDWDGSASGIQQAWHLEVVPNSNVMQPRQWQLERQGAVDEAAGQGALTLMLTHPNAIQDSRQQGALGVDLVHSDYHLPVQSFAVPGLVELPNGAVGLRVLERLADQEIQTPLGPQSAVNRRELLFELAGLSAEQAGDLTLPLLTDALAQFETRLASNRSLVFGLELGFPLGQSLVTYNDQAQVAESRTYLLVPY